MRTAGALFNLTVKEERSGVAGKTTSFFSDRPPYQTPKRKTPQAL
jgi:hypothetical protein